MSGGAADNEAKVVLTASPEQFVQFFKDAVRSFRELEQEGKRSLKGVDSQVGQLNQRIKATALGMVRDLGRSATDPLRHALSRALDDARSWRQESTRVMGAAGEDWKKIGADVDQVARRTHRLPADAMAYADTVRQITGNWKLAKEGAEDYSQLSRYLGRSSVSEMAPLAGMMDNLFGIRGQGRARAFFDQAIRGAEALGQSGQLAVQSFERLAPQLGMQTAPGARGERFAKSAAAMLPALQKLGLSPEQAEAAASQASSYFSGDLTGLQRQMRSAGVLGRKETLTDEFGRLRFTLPEMLEKTGQLARRHAKGLGGGDLLLRKLLQQNMPGFLGGAAYHASEVSRDVKTAMEEGAAPGRSPLLATDQAFAQSPEGRRQDSELRLQMLARNTKGRLWLGTQDAAVGAAAGLLDPSAPQPGAPMSMDTLRKNFRANDKISQDKGWLYTMSNGIIGDKGSIGERVGEFEGAQARLTGAQQTPGARAANGLLFGEKYQAAYERGLLGPEESKRLAREMAEENARQVLQVRVVGSVGLGSAPPVGGGQQTE